ncbi:GNAT family N-acetyltransferase [Leptospira noguchii]|uniref:N-acetyltransferase domain-containing protein n=1 Tax=Leptospira noguchii serovar Autumnalis str. ZUN142 TaxID=1085540 RepID=M6U138_9LEPT|nr:GNAT family N-acetyltransferase [Leptospira noguchii]EMO38742.1 hypothetical protein LEP1GSC186_3188 [Leptospira noguchii serovar Autumnalis str. ZUN142]
MILIEKGKIKNHSTAEVDTFEIFKLENNKEIFLKSLEADRQWVPIRLRIFTEHVNPKLNSDLSNMYELLISYNIEDLRWRWNEKLTVCGSSDFIWYICVIESKIQGIIIVKHPYQSFIYNHDIFYIDYLASAPWNRNSILSKPQYSKIGRLLIKTALNDLISIYNYTPGFNLHSLKRAESYYQKLGMKKLELDPNKQNLRKFEMDKTGCENFLSTLNTAS